MAQAKRLFAGKVDDQVSLSTTTSLARVSLCLDLLRDISSFSMSIFETPCSDGRTGKATYIRRAHFIGSVYHLDISRCRLSPSVARNVVPVAIIRPLAESTLCHNVDCAYQASEKRLSILLFLRQHLLAPDFCTTLDSAQGLGWPLVIS